MKKKALKAALAFFICWVFFVALEGLLLIGSTDPGKAPFIVLGGAHIADEIDAYSSLGFSQTYYLTYPDSFVSGEFKVFGVKVAGWERYILLCPRKTPKAPVERRGLLAVCCVYF